MSNLTIVIFAAALAAASGAAQAQSEAKVYRIGILTETQAGNAQKYWQDALRERGYIEGKNTIFEVRAAGEKFDLLPKLATELVQSKVDIILTSSTPPAVAAKQVTSTIPIVTLSADPVGTGLVRSLAQPGGNVTGVYVPVVDMAAKRLQLLKEAVPGLTSVAILWNPRNSTAQLQAKATEAAAHSLRLTRLSPSRCRVRATWMIDYSSSTPSILVPSSSCKTRSCSRQQQSSPNSQSKINFQHFIPTGCSPTRAA